MFISKWNLNTNLLLLFFSEQIKDLFLNIPTDGQIMKLFNIGWEEWIGRKVQQVFVDSRPWGEI